MQADLFTIIDTTIRRERYYAEISLMREDIMKRFNIGRHHLNNLINKNTSFKNFPQYINNIRMKEAYKLMKEEKTLSVKDVAYRVGLTPPNFRLVFKNAFGMTPKEFKDSQK